MNSDPRERREEDPADESARSELEGRLRRLAGEADPVPADVLRAARLALTLRDLDVELAELVADSARTGLLDVRGEDDEPRLVSWRTAEVTVELQVTETPEGLELRGQVTGAATRAEVGLDDEYGATRVVTLDEQGCFLLTGVVAARMRLRLTGPSGRRVVTAWLAP